MMNPPKSRQVSMRGKPKRNLEQWRHILYDRWQETLQAIEERSSQPSS